MRPPRYYPPADLLIAGPECFAAGTLVLTALGFVPIEAVRIGQLVLTHKGRWRPVVRTQSRQETTVILSGQGHTVGIEVTPNHRLWARQSEQVWRNSVRQYRRHWAEPDWLPVHQFLGD